MTPVVLCHSVTAAVYTWISKAAPDLLQVLSNVVKIYSVTPKLYTLELG